MYLRTVEETYLHRRWNTQQVKHRDIFACDECGKEYALGHKAAHAESKSLTFCSKECNKKTRSNGRLAERWRATKLKRHGVEHSSQVQGATQKMIATRVKRTGAAGPASPASASHAKFKATMTERHGVGYAMQSSEIRGKAKSSFQERYGVNNPLSGGSQFRLDHEALSAAGQKGYRSTCQHSDWMVSQPERCLVVWLRQQYVCVQTQVPIEHGTKKPWLIDVYIDDIATYVQLDGEFWHGLDKPYEELHPCGRSSYDKDREQDAWFEAHGKRLVRITDKELLMCQKTNDWSKILSRLGG